MLKKRSGRASLILLLAIAVILVSACSKEKAETADSGKATNTNSQGTDAPASTEATASHTEEDLSMKKHDPPISFSTANNVANDFKYPEPGMTAEDNEWTRLLKDELGIEVTYKYITSTAEEWKTKQNLMMASGDFPDLFTGNDDTLEQLYAADKLTDMKPYFDKYASPLLKDIYSTSDGQRAMQLMTRDGKMLGFPTFGSGIDETTMIWIRQDWLDKLGLQPPKTFADVQNISRAFTEQDPNGDGRKTFGLGLIKNLSDYVFSADDVFHAFHAYTSFGRYPNGWIKQDDGTVAFGSIQPEVKQALQALQDMYKAGQIDPEFGTKDGSKVQEDVINGKIGLFYGRFWAGTAYLSPMIEKVPEAVWKSYPIVSADDKPALQYQSPTNIAIWYFVPKTAKHPEAVIQAANMFAEKVYGPKAEVDKYYIDPVTGASYWNHAPVSQIQAKQQTLQTYQLAMEALAGTKKPEELPKFAAAAYKNVNAYLNEGDKSKWGDASMYGPDSSVAVSEQYVNNNQFFYDTYIPSTKTMIEKGATLKTLQDTVFTKIIMGEAPIDDFDKFVADWKKLGGDDILKEANEWYARNK